MHNEYVMTIKNILQMKSSTVHEFNLTSMIELVTQPNQKVMK